MEVLTVLTILLVLLSIVVLGAKAVRESGRRSAAQEQLALIGHAIDEYASYWPKWKTAGVVVADRGWPDFTGGRLFDPAVFVTIDPFNNHLTFKGYYSTPGVKDASGVLRPLPSENHCDYVGIGDVLSGNICLAYSLTAASGKGPYLADNDQAVLKDVTDPVLLETFSMTGDVQKVKDKPLLPGYKSAPELGAKHAQVLVDPWGTPYRYFWAYRDATAYTGWRPVKTADSADPAFRVAEGFVLESAGPNKRFGNLWEQTTPTQREYEEAADNLTLRP